MWQGGCASADSQTSTIHCLKTLSGRACCAAPSTAGHFHGTTSTHWLERRHHRHFAFRGTENLLGFRRSRAARNLGTTTHACSSAITFPMSSIFQAKKTRGNNAREFVRLLSKPTHVAALPTHAVRDRSDRRDRFQLPGSSVPNNSKLPLILVCPMAVIRKQISMFFPVTEWRALRQEAARLGIPMTELCRRWLRPHIEQLPLNSLLEKRYN